VIGLKMGTPSITVLKRRPSPPCGWWRVSSAPRTCSRRYDRTCCSEIPETGGLW